MSYKSKHLWLIALASLFAIVLAACTTASGSPSDPEEEMDMVEGEDMDHDDEHDEGDDHEHEDTGVERVPNNGAVIRLISPEDGAVIQGNEVEFEIEVENFVLNEDGNHWHIYIDGESWGMVLGDTTTQVLRGIPAGEHHVSVFLSNGDHQDLEDHASADITIEE